MGLIGMKWTKRVFEHGFKIIRGSYALQSHCWFEGLKLVHLKSQGKTPNHPDIVAALITLAAPHTSSSLYRPLKPPPTLQFPNASFLSFQPHNWFSIVTLPSTKNREFKSLLAFVGLQPSTACSSNATLSTAPAFPPPIFCLTWVGYSLTVQISNILCVLGVYPNDACEIYRMTPFLCLNLSELPLFSLFQDIGIDGTENELLLDDHLVLKFKPFESIRGRILSLQSLGISGLALYRLISKRPDVLTATEIVSLMCFVRDDLEGKIEPAQFERLLSATEPGSLLVLRKRLPVLLHHGIPQEKLAHVLNNVNLTKATSQVSRRN